MFFCGDRVIRRRLRPRSARSVTVHAVRQRTRATPRLESVAVGAVMQAERSIPDGHAIGRGPHVAWRGPVAGPILPKIATDVVGPAAMTSELYGVPAAKSAIASPEPRRRFATRSNAPVNTGSITAAPKRQPPG